MKAKQDDLIKDICCLSNPGKTQFNRAAFLLHSNQKDLTPLTFQMLQCDQYNLLFFDVIEIKKIKELIELLENILF